MADGITLDKVNVEIESNSSKANNGIDKLTESINKLKTALSGGVNGLSNLNSTIKGISGNLSASAQSIDNVAKTLNRRGFDGKTIGIRKTSKELQNLKSTANTLSGSFTGLRLENALFGKLTKEEIVDGIVKAKIYTKVANGMKQTTKFTTQGLKITKQYIGQTRNATKETKDFSKALSLVKIAATFRILKSVYNGIKSLVKSSAEYISNMNYFNTTMGTMRDRGNQFVSQMSNDFYLDPSNLMNYMASFNSLIKGFGIAEEQSYKMSKNLTQLSYDLAAFKGLSIEDAMQKIKSGISGELEPMRAIGVALDQATLQETAYDLGIKKRVNTMTRAQKTELLYYQMMKSTAEAQNYFASTLAKTVNQLDGSTKLILNPATALSILKQQFTQLGRAIGNIFIPILTKMIPYIMAATQLLTDFANAVASFLGFNIEDYNFSKALGNTSAGIESIGNEADKTAKKVKGMLAPFDELNTIDFGNNSGGNTGISGGGSLGLPEQNYDWLKNDALTKKVEEIKKKFQDILPIVKAIGITILGWKVGSTVINFLDKIGILDKTKWLKKALGLSLVLGGIWLQYNSIKKMINGDLSGATLGQFFMGAGMTALGTLLLTGSWQIAAGVALISFTVAWSLGLKEKFMNWLSNKMKKIFPTGIGFKWENGIPKVEINPIMLISFALQWGSRKKNQKEAKTIGESIVGGVAETLTETALTATLGPRSR